MENLSPLLCFSIPGLALVTMAAGRIVARIPFAEKRLVERFNQEKSVIETPRTVLSHDRAKPLTKSIELTRLNKMLFAHSIKRILFGNLEKASQRYLKEYEVDRYS